MEKTGSVRDSFAFVNAGQQSQQCRACRSVQFNVTEAHKKRYTALKSWQKMQTNPHTVSTEAADPCTTMLTSVK